ncbi:P-loop containing nucleoside triphosphate hydrolase protein [Tricladium varicosporioides]|nr:P-loop containing nucleoside triphosphate hydrolase protein [Hymenoscyphus varicosporioides]
MVEYERADRDIILVMGLTGAGKTYFINQLIGARLKEGHTLKSCTQGCQIVETNVGNTEFVIMDCPGFDDTTRSDADILKVISEQLSAVRLQGYNLKGIIYLRRITDNRMQGSEMSAINLFKKLVGEDALCNVVLATTMWGKVTDLAEANARDSELREEYWSDMKSRGATTTRFDGTTASAEGIASQLLGKKPVVLKVQEQLVDQGMPLNQTAAGVRITATV